MIVCNHCGGNVSDRDANCRECGAPNPLAPRRVVPLPHEDGGITDNSTARGGKNEAAGRRTLILGFVGSSVVVAVLTAVTVVWLMGSKDGAEVKAASEATPAHAPSNTPAQPSPLTTPMPTPTASSTPTPAPTPERISPSEVASFIDGWRDAWESSDIRSYASYYADDFVGRNYSEQTGYRTMTRAEWLADKRQKFARSGYVSVETGQQSVSDDGSLAVVTFSQTFRSDNYSDFGTKTLRLRRDSSGALRIVREDFRPR